MSAADGRDTVEISLPPSAVPAVTPDDVPPVAPGPARIKRTDAKLGVALKWSYALTTGGNAVVALMTFVLAAILSPKEFGVVTLAMVWVALGLILLQHGPTLAVIQQDDITDDHLNAAFWSTLVGAAGFCALFAALTPLWAAANRLPELVPVCLALSPMVFIQALNVIPDAVLRRQMQMRGIAIRMLVANLIGGAAAIGVAVAGYGLWALIVQQLAWPTLYAVMLWSMIDWRPRRPRLAEIRGPLRDIRRTSVQTYSGAVGSYLSVRVDVVVMGLFFGPLVIGIYRFAARFAEMVMELAAGGMRLVSLPHLARHGQDKPALGRELSRLVHGTAVLAFPALGVVAGAAHPLVLAVGDQWADAAYPLRVLCLVSAVIMVSTLFGVALQAMQNAGTPALFTWITMGLAAVAVPISSVLSASGSTVTKLMYVAWAMLLVQAAVAVVLGWILFRRLRIPPWRSLVVAAPAVASGVGAAVAGTLTYTTFDVHNRFLELFVVGWAAVGVAGIILLALDGEVRPRVTRLVANRLARRGAPA
jgi:PST family polysaccharide transporter